MGQPSRGCPAQEARESPGPHPGVTTRNPRPGRRNAALTVAVVATLTLLTTSGPPTRIPAPAAATVVVDDRAEAQELFDLRQAASRAGRDNARLSTAFALPVSVLHQHPAVVAAGTPRVVAPARVVPARRLPAATRPAAHPAAVVPAPPAGAAGIVVAYVRAQIGKPYVFATAGPNTFDCSGLVMAAYLRIGISLPHQTGGLISRGRAVARNQLAPGDLVFPSSGHVGIYVGGGLIVHASTPATGVKISTIYSFYAARRIL